MFWRPTCDGSLGQPQRSKCAAIEKNHSGTDRQTHQASWPQWQVEFCSGPRWNFELRANVDSDFGGVIIHEMADTVVGNAAELRPFAEGADRRLAPSGKDAAGAKTDDVSELGAEAGSGNSGRIHATGRVSTRAHEKARNRPGCGLCGATGRTGGELRGCFYLDDRRGHLVTGDGRITTLLGHDAKKRFAISGGL